MWLSSWNDTKVQEFDDAAIVAKKGHDYRINFWLVTKNCWCGRLWMKWKMLIQITKVDNYNCENNMIYYRDVK